MTKILKTVDDVISWKNLINRGQSNGKRSLGFVPTMGGLHEGHLSLIRRSLLENTFTIVSVFLNRRQFENIEDFKTYPSNLSQDIEKLKELQIDAVFTPSEKDMYSDNYKYIMTETHLSKSLCGRSRKGHFDGVLTVVLKLFNIIKPSRAYFGEKDSQQLELVRGLVDAFFLKVQIVPCFTVREKSGLALSSRNERLSLEGRRYASEFFKILTSYIKIEEVIEQLKNKNFEVDYIEDKGDRRYGAVFYENVRLIDNVKISEIKGRE